MSQPRYSKDHEYVIVEGDVGTVGISEHAQAQLGDVVFVELPAVGDKVAKGAQAAVVESVKAASEVFSPASGEVVARQRRARKRAEPHQRGCDGQGLDRQDQALRPGRTRRADGRSRLSGFPQDDRVSLSMRYLPLDDCRSRADAGARRRRRISTNSSPTFPPTSG